MNIIQKIALFLLFIALLGFWTIKKEILKEIQK